MDFLWNVIVVLHFIGLASVLGGFLVQMSAEVKGVNAAMLHGALTQLVTGLIMFGLLEAGLRGDFDDQWKLTVKLLLTIVITVLAFIGRRRQPPQTALWGAIGGLSLLTVIIAVFW
jgi:hypothetical protein